MEQQITITDNAAAQIQKLMARAPEGTQGVRLNVKPRGCSGNSYQMEYIPATEPLSGDDVFTKDQAALYIPKIHSWMLYGITVDYAEDEMGNAKFRFKNPNEKGRCGCGESFYVEIQDQSEKTEHA